MMVIRVIYYHVALSQKGDLLDSFRMGDIKASSKSADGQQYFTVDIR
jgi:hypothetical protein